MLIYMQYPSFHFFPGGRGICRQCSISGAVRVVGMPEYDAMGVLDPDRAIRFT